MQWSREAGIVVATPDASTAMHPGRAAAAGLVATGAMTALWLVEPSVGLPKIAVGQILGTAMSVSVAHWYAGAVGGWLIHLIVGVLFALAYARVFASRLPGSAVMRGALFGVLLFLFAQVVCMPLVGAGMFSGGDAQLLLGSLLGHLAYGVVLGWIYHLPMGTLPMNEERFPAFGARSGFRALLIVAASIGAAGRASATPAFHTNGSQPAAYLDGMKSVPSRALLMAIENATASIPSFSRQTGLPCAACHYQFPQLSPFGRLFKLNGYTMTGISTIMAGDSSKPSLKLSTIPPLSAMIVTSLTHTGNAQPAAQNNSVLFPDQASLFLGGEITPRVGAFMQFTYAAQDGTFGVDNLDFRYANHTTWLDKDLLLGVTLHNNPTVQDVWNTVPAWSYPFMSSSVAPSPIASTLIEGGLSQQVLGLGGYALWDNLLYAEVTGYRSAQQGTHAPQDSASTNVTSGVIPYMRLALQHSTERTYLMFGGFGFAGAHLYPKGVTGPTDRYTTLGVDAQVEHKLDDAGRMLIGRSRFINEAQSLDATFDAGGAQGSHSSLRSFQANASYLTSTAFAGTVGYFTTTGTSDTLRFAPGSLTGSRVGSPNTRGMSGELTYNPWQNTRLSLQYIMYTKFNGSTDDYDGVGRRASDNNTLYLYTWVAF